MRVIVPGHVYELDHIDGGGKTIVTFVGKEPQTGRVFEGVTTQEILRMLIDRTWYCDSCMRWFGNDQIVHHFQMGIVLHEARALIRTVERGELQPEHVMLSQNGHYYLRHAGELSPYARYPRSGGPSTGDVNAPHTRCIIEP